MSAIGKFEVGCSGEVSECRMEVGVSHVKRQPRQKPSRGETITEADEIWKVCVRLGGTGK